jgi:hypothetical protein
MLGLQHQNQLRHLCPCSRCVEENIVDIATKFNARGLLMQGAPRKKTVADDLRRVSEAASNLANALVGLDNYSREYLLVLDELDRIRPILNAYNAAAASALPKPETEQGPSSDGRFVETLMALQHYVSLRLKRLTGCDSSETVVDRGGSTNLLKEELSPQGWYIIQCCWIAFENCRPGEATSSQDGKFVAFVNAVYEYATGQTEENATLVNWAKKLAKPLRHHDRLLEKLGAHEVELEHLQGEPSTAEREARIVELDLEIPNIRQQVVDALLATSPSNLRSKAPSTIPTQLQRGYEA